MNVLDPEISDQEFRIYEILKQFSRGLTPEKIGKYCKKSSVTVMSILSNMIREGYVKKKNSQFSIVTKKRQSRKLQLSYSEEAFLLWVSQFSSDIQKQIKKVFCLIGFNLRNNPWLQKRLRELDEFPNEKIINGVREFYGELTSGRERYCNFGRLRGYIRNASFSIAVEISNTRLCSRCGKETWKNELYCKHCNHYLGEAK